jgi:hypothetical protein
MGSARRSGVLRAVPLLLIMLLVTPYLGAYSILTHQTIIDSCWDGSIKPLLKRRFPKSTVEELQEAHGYAYGGSIIQDAGYYPFGSKLFTNLLHYVRSGDFIEALVSESRDLNEYAFALGALAHYSADNSGHPLAVNRSVPLVYPELRSRFGDAVPYADAPSKHLKLEFAFDVLQVARGSYPPETYRDFIGFKVSKPVLERAFHKVYCLEMSDLFASVDLALGSYRYAVGTIIPEMTKVAWQTKKKEIQKLRPGITRDQFLYRLSRTEYEKAWGDQYEKPGFVARILSFLFRILPKIGFLKALGFRVPTREAERLFLASFRTTVDMYRETLDDVARGRLDLRNTDFDTGRPTRAGEYRLADETYSELLRKLVKDDFSELSSEMRADLLRFYADPGAVKEPPKHKKEWRETVAALQRLRAIPESRAGH